MCKKREPLPYKTLFEAVPGLWALRIGHGPMLHPVLPVSLVDIPLDIPPLPDRGRAWLPGPWAAGQWIPAG